MSNMRAKMVLSSVIKYETYETLQFNAVSKSSYPEDGLDEDNNYARWTPDATVVITVTNPALIGQFNVGEKYYVDFTKAE